jgi:hypothetical protein
MDQTKFGNGSLALCTARRKILCRHKYIFLEKDKKKTEVIRPELGRNWISPGQYIEKKYGSEHDCFVL